VMERNQVVRRARDSVIIAHMMKSGGSPVRKEDM